MKHIFCFFFLNPICSTLMFSFRNYFDNLIPDLRHSYNWFTERSFSKIFHTKFYHLLKKKYLVYPYASQYEIPFMIEWSKFQNFWLDYTGKMWNIILQSWWIALSTKEYFNKILIMPKKFLSMNQTWKF